MTNHDSLNFNPPSKEEIMLIQPNNVTFGQYNVTDWQENLLTLIGDNIQKHMSREQELPRDLLINPMLLYLVMKQEVKTIKRKYIKKLWT